MKKGPLLSCPSPKPPKCEAIGMKMGFYSQANKTHFHKKGFALNLVLKVKVFGTPKWPIRVPFATGLR